MSDCRLTKRSRLRKRSEIKRCQNEGRRIYYKHFAIFVHAGCGEDSRLAIAVTKKIDKRAVVRNLIKRRIREVFRVHKDCFAKPVDIVVVARRGVQECEYSEYERQIVGALRSKGILRPKESSV